MLRSLSFPAVILAVAGPGTAQPASQSMARCAGLLEVVQIVVLEHENIARIEAAAVAFSQTALDAARAEGVGEPEAWVTRHRAAMNAEWAQYGGLGVFGPDFVVEIDRCRDFALERGIDMNFD